MSHEVGVIPQLKLINKLSIFHVANNVSKQFTESDKMIKSSKYPGATDEILTFLDFFSGADGGKSIYDSAGVSNKLFSTQELLSQETTFCLPLACLSLCSWQMFRRATISRSTTSDIQSQNRAGHVHRVDYSSFSSHLIGTEEDLLFSKTESRTDSL